MKDGKHEVPTGYFTLREYPDGQPVFKQPRILSDIFNVIKHEAMKARLRG